MRLLRIIRIDKIDESIICQEYGNLYFESKLFGLRNEYIEKWLRRRKINVAIDGQLQGRAVCVCCDYCVFLRDVYPILCLVSRLWMGR